MHDAGQYWDQNLYMLKTQSSGWETENGPGVGYAQTKEVEPGFKYA